MMVVVGWMMVPLAERSTTGCGGLLGAPRRRGGPGGNRGNDSGDDGNRTHYWSIAPHFRRMNQCSRLRRPQQRLGNGLSAPPVPAKAVRSLKLVPSQNNML